MVSHVTPIKTLLRMALHTGPGILYRFHLDLAPLSIAESYPDGVASVQQVPSACVALRRSSRLIVDGDRPSRSPI